MEGAIAIDINDPLVKSMDPLVKSMEQRIDALPGMPWDNPGFTILRVPAHIRKKKERYYEPQPVSIGPFHRGKDHLRPMEEHKWRFLRLMPTTHGNKILERCVKAMKELESDVRRCYVESVDLPSNEFVQMMLLDGCFILLPALGFFLKLESMLSVIWPIRLVRTDLLMLENQIPLVVLRRLFDILVHSDEELSLVEVLINFLTDDKVKSPPSNEVHHLLHLYHSNELHHLLHLYHSYLVSKPKQCYTSNDITPGQCLLQNLKPERLIPWICSPFAHLVRDKSPQPSGKLTPCIILCAMELQEAGVTFKKKDSGNFLDVTFSNGVLEIPFISIEDSYKYTLKNLLAFERCNFTINLRPLSSYTFFLSRIINRERDVAILQEHGIIANMLPNEEEATLFFNHLTQYGSVDLDEHYLAGLFKEVDKYCKSRWHSYRAKLKREYFSNPWATISLLAAIFLLILSVIRTFCAAYSYFRPPSSGPSL